MAFSPHVCGELECWLHRLGTGEGLPGAWQCGSCKTLTFPSKNSLCRSECYLSRFVVDLPLMKVASDLGNNA